jgi:REP element-mobilizing transposase RayT
MANTYSQVFIQFVFVVKGRENLIHEPLKDELYKYICGIVTGNKQKVYAIGGMPDHIHLLVSLKPDAVMSDLMRDIKSCSSKWINENKKVRGRFQWQVGFGAFSYSRWDLDRVIAYINNQEAHHAKKTFKEEYRKLLSEFEIEYDDRYLFEWIE